MKSFLYSIIEGIYDGIQKSPQHKDQISKQEIEQLVFSAFRSFVNKISVLLGSIFIYFFFRFKGIDMSSIFIIFITFWMAWVVQGNHLSQLQKLLDERKIKNK